MTPGSNFILNKKSPEKVLHSTATRGILVEKKRKQGKNNSADISYRFPNDLINKDGYDIPLH